MPDKSKDNKIEYRKVTPEEKLHVERQQNISWPNPESPSREKEIREKIDGGEYNSDNTYGAVDGNGRVLAGMGVIPYTMWFDGQRVPMAGISGVVSFPEYRRQGNVRKLLEKVLEDSYENGVVFSHLYPFHCNYYRTFGYEYCGYVKRYTLPLAPARNLKADGTAHEFINGDRVRDELIEVYENYASRHNLMISRTQDMWDEVFDITLFGFMRLHYWKGSNGKIKSWVKYKRDGDKMAVSDIAWADHEGMLGILQFMGMLHVDDAIKDMVFMSSPEFAAELYWDDPYKVMAETAHLGMNRVVNAKRALELLKKPDDAGVFAVKIIDEFARWNSGTYKVEYGSGECTVTKAEASALADIETTERSFTQLVLGCYDLRQLADNGSVTINSKANVPYKIFSKRPLLITDWF